MRLAFMTVVALTFVLISETRSGEFEVTVRQHDFGDWIPEVSSPDGKYLLVTRIQKDDNGRFKNGRDLAVLETSSWKVIGVCAGDYYSSHVLFYNSSQFVTILGGDCVSVSLETKLAQKSLHLPRTARPITTWGQHILVSPDGYSGKTLQLFDPRAGETVASYVTNTSIPQALCYARVPCKHALFHSDYHGYIFRYNFDDNGYAILGSVSRDSAILSMCLSPDKSKVLWNDYRGVGVFPTDQQGRVAEDSVCLESLRYSEITPGNVGFVNNDVIWVGTSRSFVIYDLQSKKKLSERESAHGRTFVPIVGTSSVVSVGEKGHFIIDIGDLSGSPVTLP